jgi:dTDP-glucose 4,6-dehydratase
VQGDIRERDVVLTALSGAEAVLHLAAESHVDRSIRDARAFLATNVIGTHILLDATREMGTALFVQVSTDEVYGSLGETGVFTEDSPVRPRSPYAASKASGDLLALAYHETYGLPVVVTRCSNNYGPYQHPEKLIPLTIVHAIQGWPVPVYGDGLHVRDWIHVDDHCRGILAALQYGRPGRVYNFASGREHTNIDMVRAVLAAVPARESLITFVTDRPGHDFRYGLDIRRAHEELGWAPQWSCDEGLAATVRWYLDNQAWWSPLLDLNYERQERPQHGGEGGALHG